MDYFRNPITKQMIAAIRDKIEIGQRIRFKDEEDIKLGTVIEKYNNFMVLEFKIKNGNRIKRSMTYVDYILDNKEEIEP